MLSLLTKVWFDLWGNRARTFQVVLVIALGAFGIGLVIGGKNLIDGTISDQWQQAVPPAIKLGVVPPLTDAQIRSMEKIEGVAEAEGLMNEAVEWRFPGESEWRTARLQSRDDYQAQKMERVILVSGNWPDRNHLGVIKTADSLYDVGQGQSIEVRFNDRVREFDLTGTLKPVGPFPVVFLGEPIFYADRGTFTRITGRDTFDIVQTRDLTFSYATAEATDLRIQAYFEDIGVDSFGVTFPFQDRIIPPDIPPSVELLNAIFLILGVIGGIVIILGIFLVYNSINAIINQQIQQIGVMKAIGARPGQVFFGYFLLVLAYGMLAVIISVPLGGLGARGLQTVFINLLNLEDPGFTLDMQAIAIQVLVAMLAPVLAAALPLRTGVRITVREAISTYGLTGGMGFIERVVSKVRGVPYSILLTIGNAFRNRQRVILIEFTLVLAGIVFMMVLGVNDAARYTFGEKLTDIHNYQVNLQFDEMARSQRLESLAQTNSNVTDSETWLVTRGRVRPAEQDDASVSDPRVSVYGIPAGSQMYTPELRTGEWLRDDGRKRIVLGELLAQQTGLQVGDWVTLETFNGEENEWKIAGITYDPLANTGVFVPLSAYQKSINRVGMVNTIWLNTTGTTLSYNDTVARQLTTLYNNRGFDVTPSPTFGYFSIEEIVQETQGGYSLIFMLLAIMAVIIAVVGGVGLSGVMGLNVLERTREIGVMRSIGASSWRVIGLSIGEGVLLGWLSWLIALPLSIPPAYFLATQGLSLALNQQLSYQFSIVGPAIWLGIITVLAVLASALPARGAARVSVRESLSY